jgi:hypothetical protein
MSYEGYYPSMRKRTPLAERFWVKVDKRGPVHPVLKTRCHLWTGATVKGHGVIGLGASEDGIGYAHRVAWKLYTGRDPVDQVLHRCGVRACVRRSHLFEGSQADNVKDCVEKRRNNIGERNGMAKLTEENVEEIKALRADGMTQENIAARFQVKQNTISRILSGVRRSKTSLYVR